MIVQVLKIVVLWFSFLLMLVVVLFVFLMMLFYLFYGKKVVGYLFGNLIIVECIYNVFFFILLVVGVVINMVLIFDLVDVMFFFMVLLNVLGMYFLVCVVVCEIKGYWECIDVGVILQVFEDV